ncbi:MAG: rhodanese-like domain-containing protein [Gammaproteobacteria bacterium]
MYQTTLSPDDAYTLIAQGAQLVDVRHPYEHARNALPGSVNIPLQVIQQANRQLHKDTPVLLYCNNGQRSGAAKRLLQACGFSQVHNLGSYSSYTCTEQK